MKDKEILSTYNQFFQECIYAALKNENAHKSGAKISLEEENKKVLNLYINLMEQISKYTDEIGDNNYKEFESICQHILDASLYKYL